MIEPTLPHGHPWLTGPLSQEQVEWLTRRDRAFHLIAVHRIAWAVEGQADANRRVHELEHALRSREHAPWVLTWSEQAVEEVLEAAEAVTGFFDTYPYLMEVRDGR